ncbi:MAG: M43 family zinc metalloprotease [Bacteroidota bacterium]
MSNQYPLFKAAKFAGISVFAAILSLAGLNNAFATGGPQKGFATCGSHHAMEDELRAHPERRQVLNDLENFTADYLLRKKAGEKSVLQDGNLTIPVVVHVVHNYGAERISMAQVNDAIRILTRDFNRQNPDTNVVIPRFRGIEGNPHFTFKLATKDPNGQCTNGVVYHVDPNTDRAGNNVKRNRSWNTRNYLNIWVAETVMSGTDVVGGYAYYPGTFAAGNENDGIIVTCHQFGSIGQSSSNNFSARTLTHETGHYFNLAHTFGNTNGPGVASNCAANAGDGVDDTPQTQGVADQSCPLNMPGCVAGEIANVENYMDYASCGKMFTIGQADRMQAAAAANASARNNLWSASNLEATGTADDTAATCPPKAVIYAPETFSCSGAIPITFVGYAENTVIDTSLHYFWTFNGGVPATSTLQNPSINFPNAGRFTVTLTVRNTFGSNVATATNLISAVGGTAGLISPFAESFEDPDFPAISATESFRNWAPDPPESFESTSDAAWTGTRSLMNDMAAGAALSIVSPVVDLSTIPDSALSRVYLAYRVAWAKRVTANNDTLACFSSSDCGQTWRSVMLRGNNNLVTYHTRLPLTDATFIPAANDWRQDSIRYIIQPDAKKVQFKFVHKTHGGHRLYLDNFRIYIKPLPVTGNADLMSSGISLSVYPNPSDGNASLHFKGLPGQALVAEINDMSGRAIGRLNTGIPQSGEYITSLAAMNQNLAPGIYTVHCTIGSTPVSRKMVILK